MICSTLTLSWKLFSKNALSLFILIAASHFLSWKFSWELWNSTREYAIFVWSVDYSEYITALSEHAAKEAFIIFEDSTVQHESYRMRSFFGALFSTLAYFAFLQVLVSRVVHNVLLSGRKHFGVRELLETYLSYLFIISALRALGIVLVYYVFLIVFVATAVCLGFVFAGLAGLLQVLSDIDNIEHYMLVSALLLGIVLYLLCFSRLVLAIPIAVIEDAGVVESLKRSWRMTRIYWVQILTLMLLISATTYLICMLVYEIVYGVLLLFDEANDMSPYPLDFSDLPFLIYLLAGASIMPIIAAICCSRILMEIPQGDAGQEIPKA